MNLSSLNWNKNIDFIMQFRFYTPGGEIFKGLKGVSKTCIFGNRRGFIE